MRTETHRRAFFDTEEKRPEGGGSARVVEASEPVRGPASARMKLGVVGANSNASKIVLPSSRFRNPSTASLQALV